MAMVSRIRFYRGIYSCFAYSRCLISSSRYSCVQTFPVINNQINCRSNHMVIGRCQFHVSTLNFAKKPKKKAARAEEKESDTEDEKDEEADEEEEEDLVKDYRLADIYVTTLRLDAVIAKAGLGIARGVVDQLLLEGKIRVDGKLHRKKGTEITVGTMIDFLAEPSPDNPDFTVVKRIIVHKISDRMDSHNRLTVTLKRWAALTVDDYKITASKGDDK